MKIFGWTIAAIGAVGLCTSVGLEIALCEPLYLLFAKISAGILGLGGIVLAIKSIGK